MSDSHNIRWTLDELDRQHRLTVRERLVNLWGEIDRRPLLWIATTILAFGCGFAVGMW